MDTKKYPIGPFRKPDNITTEDLAGYINEIDAFPQRIRAAVASLKEEQLDTPYREGGWTIRQLVNHCADSHFNAFMRFKLALTMDNPMIVPYDQDKWAELPDSRQISIEPALQMIGGTHGRWVTLMQSMTPEEMKKTYRHPERKSLQVLDMNAALYAWHCNHHLAHVTSLIEEKGW